MKRPMRIPSIAIAIVLAVASAAGAQTVKVTPLGSHAGELCANDRALLFEDPTGVRILYDVGRSVAGADVLSGFRRLRAGDQGAHCRPLDPR